MNLQFSAIDLSKLAPPKAVEVLDFDAILAENIALYKIEDPAWTAEIEADPIYAALRVMTYKEVALRGRVNDGVKACFLATATGTDLENLVADFNITRKVLVEATDDTAAVMEKDARLRRRRFLAPEALSNAGSTGAYMFYAMDNDFIQDVLIVEDQSAGTVKLTLLALAGSGLATTENKLAVKATLNPNLIRPVTDLLIVDSCDIVTYTIDAALKIYDGQNFAEVQIAARKKLDLYIESKRKLGADITKSGLHAALTVEGVERVVITAPANDIAISATEAAYCAPADITLISEASNE